MSAQASIAAPLPPSASSPKTGGDWLTEWKPEDPTFWAQTGSKIAWRTMWLTTATLVLSFAT